LVTKPGRVQIRIRELISYGSATLNEALPCYTATPVKYGNEDLLSNERAGSSHIGNPDPLVRGMDPGPSITMQK
jgi:hypothetical protein